MLHMRKHLLLVEFNCMFAGRIHVISYINKLDVGIMSLKVVAS